jgi:hypothetical protein
MEGAAEAVQAETEVIVLEQLVVMEVPAQQAILAEHLQPTELEAVAQTVRQTMRRLLEPQILETVRVEAVPLHQQMKTVQMAAQA